MSYVIKRDIERLIGRNISFPMVEDCLSLLAVITRASITAEKRLMIDPQTVKGAYKRREIENAIDSYCVQPVRRLNKDKEMHFNDCSAQDRDTTTFR